VPCFSSLVFLNSVSVASAYLRLPLLLLDAYNCRESRARENESEGEERRVFLRLCPELCFGLSRQFFPFLMFEAF
jgi:hypothetical protein